MIDGPSVSRGQLQAAHALTRRSALRVGGMGLLGLTMPRFLAAQETAKAKKLVARAKSVIFLFQWGGPSHLETFDMKPDAPSGIRGFHKPMSSSADGIQVNSLLPKTAEDHEQGDAHPLDDAHHEEPQLRGLLCAERPRAAQRRPAAQGHAGFVPGLHVLRGPAGAVARRGADRQSTCPTSSATVPRRRDSSPVFSARRTIPSW